MMHTWFIPALVLAGIGVRLVIYFVLSWQKALKARRLGCEEAPLYPSKDPFGVSNLLDTLLYCRSHGRYISTFRIRQPGKESIFTADPKNIQVMLATQFNDFGLGDVRRNVGDPLVGRGIFTTDGEAWSHSRSLLRPQFTRTQVSNLDMEERHVQNAMRALPVLSNGWTREFLFGKSCDSQLSAVKTDGSRDSDNFLYGFDRSVWYLSERLRFDKFYWLVDNREFRESIRMVHAFVDRYVKSVLERQAGDAKPTDSGTSTSQYVFLEALAASSKDPLQLRYESLNVLLAGRDTTASLLSWAVLILACRPDIFSRLRRDIVEQFGTYRMPRDMTFASLKSCQYLQHFINETLWLYPVVPFNRRCALRNTTLPSGGGKDGSSPIYVPKGQQVLYGSYALQRRKDIWGDDAEEFNPDRWIGRKVTWEYIPFNGGPRTCIGQQFALIKTSYVLVRLLQRFDSIEDVHAGWEVRYNATLTSAPADPVTVRLHEADD
ncbi:cytochrome P450 [Aspergillus floccosus]